MYELLLQYIHPELLILVILLYAIGIAIKKSHYIKDEFIPFILGLTSIFICAIYVLSANETPHGYQQICALIFDIIIQGICCSAASVYVNQLIKQNSKLKEEEPVKEVKE